MGFVAGSRLRSGCGLSIEGDRTRSLPTVRHPANHQPDWLGKRETVKRLFSIINPLLAAGLMASLLIAAGGCSAPADTPAPAETTDEQAADDALLEFDLGQHRLRTYDPVSDTTRHLDFQLGATINRDDEATFKRMLE